MDTPFMGTFTIGQTLDRGFRLYRQTIGRIFIMMAASSLLGLGNVKYMLAPDPLHPFAVFNALYFLSIFGGVFVWIVSIRYVFEKSIGNNPSVGEMLKLARPSDILLIFTAIIWYIAIIIASILLLIPGIYLVNICMIGMILIVVEKNYFFDGIGRTFKLTRGRWWKTFVINLVTFLIVMTPTSIGMILFMGPYFKNFTNTVSSSSAVVPPNITLFTIIGYAVYVLILALTYPILTAVNVVHYNSLRSEKEHKDLDSQLDALDKAPAAGA